MLNIKVQCCGMALILLVTFFYYHLPRIDIIRKRVFGYLIPFSFLTVLTDIVSVAAIFYSESLPDILVKSLCKLYLIFLITYAYLAFMYLCADIYPMRKRYTTLMYVYGIFYFVSAAVICLLPISYVCTDNGNSIYSEGPATLAAYCCFIIVFISIIVQLIIGASKMRSKKAFAVGCWLAIWFISAVVQFFSKEQLLVSFAGCIGMLIIFLAIENPELYLDSASGFFHTKGMGMYITEQYFNGTRFYMINTTYTHDHTSFYKKLGSKSVFVGDGEIYLVFLDPDKFEEAVETLTERFRERYTFIIDDSSVAGSSDELFSLIKAARRFYRKEKSGFVFRINNDTKLELEERDNVLQLIKEAIENERLEPFFQPIYSVKTGKFSSAEALSRIRTKDGAIVGPNRFIPVAEQEGSIITLGNIMLEKVCGFLRENDPESLGLDYVEVNLSVVQGEDKRLSASVLSIMDRYSINAAQINLEITETASLNGGKEQLLENMTILRGEGIEFSLDDFGTGQSNLDYMSTMPVQLVKFDRSMTQGYFASEKTRCIMTAAVKMIHEMGMRTVVEGIETKEQFECMKDLGADYIQGYYFSKPLPKDEFIAFLKEHNN